MQLGGKGAMGAMMPSDGVPEEAGQGSSEMGNAL